MKSPHMHAVQICMHFQVIHRPQVKMLVKLFKIFSLFFFFSIQVIFTFIVIRPFYIPGEQDYSISSVSLGLLN